MLGKEYYREARRYPERAAAERDPAIAEQWRRYAASYDTLAAMIDGDGAPAPSLAASMQRQPMQQQQTKLEDDK